MTTGIERIVHEVSTLSRGEILRLRQVLDEALADSGRPAASTEEAFQRRLIAAGLLVEPRPPGAARKARQPRQRVEVKGKPLSVTVIEERR